MEMTGIGSIQIREQIYISDLFLRKNVLIAEYINGTLEVRRTLLPPFKI